MNSDFFSYLQSSIGMLFGQTLSELSVFLPRILGALLVLLLGSAIAKFLRRIVIGLFSAIKISNVVENTPVEHFLKNADLKNKVEEIFGSVFYWLLMLVVIHTTVSVLGLDPVSSVLDKLLSYIPHIFSAILVLFFGVILAGVAESVVKGSIKSIDGKSSRLLGKVSSYMVIIISVMAAISELGIASEFIMILFVGFITTVSLGAGLALGLGGQDLVRKVLDKWYSRLKEDIKE